MPGRFRIIPRVSNAAPTTAERARPLALSSLARHVVAHRRRGPHGDRRGFLLRPADRLAAARGRDARALHEPRLGRRAHPDRARRTRRRAAALPLRVGDHAHRRRARRAAARLDACSPIASVPLIAVLVARLTDRTVALVATALVVPSWMLLFHGIYGRMYSIFLFTATLSYLALLSAIERRDRRSWILWGLAILACIATHPYGALVLASQGLYVLYARRFREAVPAFVDRRGARDSVLAERHRAREPLRRRRRRRRHEARQPVLDPEVPRTRRRRLHRRVGHRRASSCCSSRPSGMVLLVRRNRASAAFVACVLVTPFVFFAVTRIGSGIASPESRHLIFVLPFFATLLALPLVRLARSPAGIAFAAAIVLALRNGRGCVGPPQHAHALRRRAADPHRRTRRRHRPGSRRRAGRTTSSSGTTRCSSEHGSRTARSRTPSCRGPTRSSR